MESLFYSTAYISGTHFTAFVSSKGITRIFINDKDYIHKDSFGEVDHSATRLHRDDPYLFEVFKQLSEYFSNKRKTFDIPLDINGTEFQVRVWNELKKIPYGKTISYKTLSEKVGDSNAMRAVGKANGANPVPIIIPCHRVINHDGSLGGYSCGLNLKEKLLELEGILSLELFS